jgi:hypothetical protein
VTFNGKSIFYLNKKECKNLNQYPNHHYNYMEEDKYIHQLIKSMCDFQDFPLLNYTEWHYKKLEEMIFLCSLHLRCKDCEKFAIIQDVDTNPKFFKKVVL